MKAAPGWSRRFRVMEATSRQSVSCSAHFRSAGEIGQTTAFIPDILCAMIIVSYFLLYRRAPRADRALFRDVLGFRSIDVGELWRIFAMPPAEAEIHLRDGEFSQQHAGHQLMGAMPYLMCDQRDGQIEFFPGRNVHCSGMQPAACGRAAPIPSPSGGRIGLYQPWPMTAFNLN